MSAADNLDALEGHLWNDLRHFSRKVPSLAYDSWAVRWMLRVAGACAARTMHRSYFLKLCEQAYQGTLDITGRHREQGQWPASPGMTGDPRRGP